jgi:hypothetical protein
VFNGGCAYLNKFKGANIYNGRHDVKDISLWDLRANFEIKGKFA